MSSKIMRQMATTKFGFAHHLTLIGCFILTSGGREKSIHLRHVYISQRLPPYRQKATNHHHSCKIFPGHFHLTDLRVIFWSKPVT